jgi:hypothetical protein
MADANSQYHTMPMPRCAVALRSCLQNGMVVAWHGRGIGMAWHGMCESNTAALFNLYEPCGLYIGQAHRYPPNTLLYVFFKQVYVPNFLNMLHTLRLFLFKMPLFNNATFFVSCIIRILHTGCAKI